MELQSNHAWVTRYFFPLGGESRQNQYMLHFDDPHSPEDLIGTVGDLLKDFIEEIGGQWTSPGILDKRRFFIEGPKGFAIIEIAPAYTEEEVNKMEFEPKNLDLSIWEQMFKSSDAPSEKSREKDQA